MKATLIPILVFIFVLNTGYAQKVKEAEVSQVVLTSFQSHFSGAKVKEWEKESDGRYIAEFKWEGHKTSATFTFQGRLMHTEQETKISALPKRITDYISVNYVGYKTRKAKIITGSNKKHIFKAEIKKKKEKWYIVFDNEGNFLRKESTEPEEEEKD